MLKIKYNTGQLSVEEAAVDPSQSGLSPGQIAIIVAVSIFLLLMVVLEFQNWRNKKDITPKTLGSLSPVVPSTGSPTGSPAGNSSNWKKSVGDFIKEVVADEDDEEDEDGDDDEDDGEEPELIKAIESVTNVYVLRIVVKYLSEKYNNIVGRENDALLKKVILFKSELADDDWDLIQGVAEEGSELERVASQGGKEDTYQ